MKLPSASGTRASTRLSGKHCASALAVMLATGVLMFSAPACEGHVEVEIVTGGGNPGTGDSVSSSTSSLGLGGGGGSTGQGGTGTGGQGVGGGDLACSTAEDCPPAPNACVLVGCSAGACVTTNLAEGSFLGENVPADCHDTVCDGAGNAKQTVDVTNVPPSNEPCLQGSCDVDGTPGTLPLPMGVSCTSSTGGKLCDGAGHCVACLEASDCPAGESCGPMNTCSQGSCMDGLVDGNETDVDCGGGTCPPCALEKDCLQNQDCTSGFCEAKWPYRCIADHCRDGRLDADETDEDCGGSCLPCLDLEHCKVDQDCISDHCDPTRQLCIPATCFDGILDSSETDVDCGGQCKQCDLGQKCEFNFDCLSNACDGIASVCDSDHCFDNREDADETGLDCGGPTCAARCAGGGRCLTTSDCMPGLICSTTLPHICQ